MISIFYKLNISILITLLIVISTLSEAHAAYKRCWIQNGFSSPNCAPADGYFFRNEQGIYKKCIVASGKLETPCIQEDGYTLIQEKNRWHSCPIQNGKLQPNCMIAQGYQIIPQP